MTHDDQDATGLARLSPCGPDPQHTQRVRARCRAELARRRRRSQQRDAAAAYARRAFPVFVVGLCAWCVVDLLGTVMQTLALAQ